MLIDDLPCTARILRLLATNHIFNEVSPDVFAHNRVSCTLDTGKSLAEILAELGFIRFSHTDVKLIFLSFTVP